MERARQRSLIILKMRAFAVLGIVWVHAPQMLTLGLFEFFSYRLPMACVPFYFVISGFFLLQKPLEDQGVYAAELRKRISSIAIPFLFWNALVLLGSFLMASKFPTLSHGGAYTLKEFSLKEMVTAVLGWGRPPINYQFWFLRNLIVFAVCSKILRLLLLKCAWLGLVLALVVETQFRGAGYYYVGGMLAVLAGEKFLMVSHPKISATVALVILVVSVCEAVPPMISLAASFALMIGLANIKYGPKLEAVLSSLAGNSFFIYASHALLIVLLARILSPYWAMTLPIAVFEYFAIPTFVLLLTWWVSIGLRRFSPGFYRVITGVR